MKQNVRSGDKWKALFNLLTPKALRFSWGCHYTYYLQLTDHVARSYSLVLRGNMQTQLNEDKHSLANGFCTSITGHDLIHASPTQKSHMMVLWHGNILCITGPLWKKSIIICELSHKWPVMVSFVFVVSEISCWTNSPVEEVWHHCNDFMLSRKEEFLFWKEFGCNHKEINLWLQN